MVDKKNSMGIKLFLIDSFFFYRIYSVFVGRLIIRIDSSLISWLNIFVNFLLGYRLS